MATLEQFLTTSGQVVSPSENICLKCFYLFMCLFSFFSKSLLKIRLNVSEKTSSFIEDIWEFQTFLKTF